MKTKTGRPLKPRDQIRVANGKQLYTVISVGGGRAVAARYVEIADASEWVHADEPDPMTTPARLAGDA